MCNKNNVYFSSLKTAVTALYCLKTTRAHVGESLLLLDSLYDNSLSSRPWLLFFCPTVHLSKQFTAVRHPQTLCRLSECEKHHLTFFPPGSIHRWHISEDSLSSVQLDVKLHRTLTLRDAQTQKLFIHLLLSLAEIFSASFAINVLQTASPCLWVLLFSDTFSLH